MASDCLARRPRRFLEAFAMLFLSVAATASAQISVTAGAHALLPNTPNQPVDILVSAGVDAPTVLGVDLFVELGDGIGPIAEPVFHGVPGSTDGFDTLSGIFANGFLVGGEGPVQIAPQITTGFVFPAGPGTAAVAPDGLLATLLIDTTGFLEPGIVFDLRLNNFQSAGFPSPSTTLVDAFGVNLPSSSVTIHNGAIVIADPATLAGDYNHDGAVDAADYTVWRDTLGENVTPGNAADGNGDGLINAGDYAVFVDNYGSVLNSRIPSAPIPEPTTVLLSTAGLVLLSTLRSTPNRDGPCPSMPPAPATMGRPRRLLE